MAKRHTRPPPLFRVLIVFLCLGMALAGCGSDDGGEDDGDDDGGPPGGGQALAAMTNVTSPSMPPGPGPAISPGIGPHNSLPTPDEYKELLSSGDYDGLLNETMPVVDSDPYFVAAVVYGSAAQLHGIAPNLDEIRSQLESVEGYVRSELWNTQPDLLSLLLIDKMTLFARSGDFLRADDVCEEAIELFPTHEVQVQDLFEQETGRDSC